MKYFDYNAFHPINEQVAEILYQTRIFNPSAIHSFGREARKKIDYTRDLVKKTFANQNYEIIFCGNGTEANNFVFHSFPNHQHLISSIEHVSVLRSAKNPQIIQVDANGLLDFDDLNKILQNCNKNNQAALVSIMMANNETGVMQNMHEIVKICRKFDNILIHSDAIQTCGKIDFNIANLDLDLATISSHKFGGAPCIGMLIYKNDLKLKPLIVGGHQENSLRGGTENAAAIYANHVLFENWHAHLKKNHYTKQLRDLLEGKIKKIHPNVKINSENVARVPNTSSIIMPNVASQIQIIFFDLHGFAVSNGSACNSGTVQNSHVLQAMQVPSEEAECVVRISLGPENTQNDVEEFVNLWEKLFRKNN